MAPVAADGTVPRGRHRHPKMGVMAMKNVEYKQQGNKLINTVDLEQEHGPSASGKTIIIASTEGNQTVGKNPKGQPVVLGLNIYRKP